MAEEYNACESGDCRCYKHWTCRCGYEWNPEWASECSACGRCDRCGEILPTDPDPRRTYQLREPHRRMHDNTED